MHSTGIEKNGNSTEKIIGGKEAEDGISGRFCVKKWVETSRYIGRLQSWNGKYHRL